MLFPAKVRLHFGLFILAPYIRLARASWPYSRIAWKRIMCENSLDTHSGLCSATGWGRLIQRERKKGRYQTQQSGIRWVTHTSIFFRPLAHFYRLCSSLESLKIILFFRTNRIRTSKLAFKSRIHLPLSSLPSKWGLISAIRKHALERTSERKRTVVEADEDGILAFAIFQYDPNTSTEEMVVRSETHFRLQLPLSTMTLNGEAKSSRKVVCRKWRAQDTPDWRNDMQCSRPTLAEILLAWQFPYGGRKGWWE